MREGSLFIPKSTDTLSKSKPGRKAAKEGTNPNHGWLGDAVTGICLRNQSIEY